ncbi:uncharacterized protein LOC108144915 [Drosophila elegans]|uniref:uncharacterized protein LOC108144915 n=1 Tax=Drosophila elegans TaxID=30023 RepID=UPI0007E7C93F|nr:uncharacterized protein LOC108144915 [Drosophila elegans]
MKSVTFVLCLLVLGAHSLLVFAVDCEVGGQKFKTGETYSPEGRCMQYKCQGPRKLSALTCPTIASLKPCLLTSDLSKPYPGCCPKYDC